MNRPLTILFVTDDPSHSDAARTRLAREPGVRVLIAPTLASALDMARFARPELIVLGGPRPDPAALEGCRRLRAESEMALSTMVLIAPPDAAELREQALDAGFDGFLNHPLQETDALALVHAQLRLRRAHDQLRVDCAEFDHLRKAASRNLEQIVGLLACVVEMGRPGAGERSKRIGRLARHLAARFGVPEVRLWDLEIAAQVHEIGWLVADCGGADEGDRSVLPPWQRAVSTAALLDQVEGLKETATLVHSLYENWDGTGAPDRLQMGQIPLRCRILRVVIDFMSEMERAPGESEEDVLARLAGHSGTLYDPMVLVHFSALHADPSAPDWRVDRVVLPVHDLAVGMILAEDLCTESGLKLLARGTRLTPAALNTILRRHLAEPILHGATVLRRGRAPGRGAA
jgi:response regulator RpfG family c-di-GMP phosphodiesterase